MARHMNRLMLWPLFTLPLLGLGGNSLAQDMYPEKIAELATVKVTPRPEGPLLWRAQKGEATLWFLVIPRSTPRNEAINLDRAYQVARTANSFISSPRISTSFEGNPFKLFGTYMKVRSSQRNPGGKLLSEVLNSKDYNEWSALASRYSVDTKELERLRPYFASHKLHAAALKSHGMMSTSFIWKNLQEIARKDRKNVIFPKADIYLDNPTQSIKRFAGAEMNDGPCFRAVLKEIAQLPNAEIVQAQAWAAGDIDGMTRIAASENRRMECESISIALADDSNLNGKHLDEMRRQAWLSSLSQAISNGPIAFGILPIELALGQDGYLATLENSGYKVTVQ
jgi:hypothetical protein